MFGMLENLAKAAVSVVVAPVALVADIVTLPASAEDPHGEAFGRTSAALGNASDCLKKAVTPDHG